MDLINRLIDIHKLVIEGKSDSSLMEERSWIRSNLCISEKKDLSDIFQKSKIRWSVEGDENSQNYHGFLKKKKKDNFKFKVLKLMASGV